MDIEFLGAAQEVTGSMHLVHTPHARVLLDCGLFQGRRRESTERNSRLPLQASEVDAVVLSHAHIDHSGALPVLVKNGFRGVIYTTPATRDLCAAMLEDSAMIQEQDARYITRAIQRHRAAMEPVEPLYTRDDVAAVLEAMVTVPYRRTITIDDGVRLTLSDAGHVLGSAIVVLDVDDEGQNKRVVFTGDLGRKNMPILRDPEVVSGANVLVTESTYGDRDHAPFEEMDEALGKIVRDTHARGGKIVIPAFALERAQELLWSLSDLRHRGVIPDLPVYVDSPLTVKVTDVFRMHPECFDREARERFLRGPSPLEFAGLRYVSDVEESKRIDLTPDPAVIISASGMCEAGRVLHHLKATVDDPKNAVVIVGFQAQHTLGRRIVERQRRVKIFGEEHELSAEVHVLNGFSAHAGQSELVDYAETTRDRGKLRQVVLVHGEPRSQEALKERLEAERFPTVYVPKPGQRITV